MAISQQILVRLTDSDIPTQGKHIAEYELKLVEVDYDPETDEPIMGYGVMGPSFNTQIKRVVIPSEAQVVNGFNGCQNLTDVTIYGNRVIVNGYSGAFFPYGGTINPNLVIRVPKNVVDAYKEDSRWSQFADHIVGF